MALRRCFSAKVTEADPFKALTVSAQALYLHLCMAADDDGFINCASSIACQITGGVEALEELTQTRFLLAFGNVYVVKHWRIANSLKNDRHKELNYPEIASCLWVKNNRAYTDHPAPFSATLYEVRTGEQPPAEWNPNGIQMESKWNPNGIQMESKWNPSGIQTESNWNPNRTEPNRTEPNRTEPNRTEAADAAGGWDRVLGIYPREKIGDEKAAAEAYRASVFSTADRHEMEDNLKLWLQSEQWTKEDGRYIPKLENWITRGTWHTRPPKMAIPTGGNDHVPTLAQLYPLWLENLGQAEADRRRAEYIATYGDI